MSRSERDSFLGKERERLLPRQGARETPSSARSERDSFLGKERERLLPRQGARETPSSAYYLLESCTRWVNLRLLRVPIFTGRALDKKSFVRVTECWPNACESDMSKKFNATQSLCYKGLTTFSSGGETID